MVVKYALGCGVMVVAVLTANALAQPRLARPQLLEVTKIITDKQLAQAAAAQEAERQLREAEDAAARLSAAVRAQREQAEAAEQKAQESRNQFRTTFLEAVETLRDENRASLTRYQTVFTGLAIGAIVLALAASVFAFVKWSVVAGICSIVTTAVLTAPNIFSVRENLEFHRYIDNQSYALGLEARITAQPAPADIERWKTRWTKLAEFVGAPPQLKDPNQLTREIIEPGG